MTARPLTIPVGDAAVSALLERPPETRLLYVVAHGAGAGMRHPFMNAAAAALAARGIATLRYQIPYMEAGRRRPDSPRVAQATVVAAAREALELEPGLPLIAGGKSFGGRMTSQAAAEEPLAGVRGIAFLGFPLHAPGKPGVERAAHLTRVSVPMLFLQGTRDAFADLELLRSVVEPLGERARLHLIEGADHGFAVPRGERWRDIHAELATAIADWAAEL